MKNTYLYVLWMEMEWGIFENNKVKQFILYTYIINTL